MADQIKKLSAGHSIEVLDQIMTEVEEARGEYDNLGERLDEMSSDTPTPSTAAPAMDGTAAAGTSTDYARADHVHPSDTSKQDALTAAQLAAANSGIDSTKVAQIEMNKNNISTAQKNGVKNLLNTYSINGGKRYGITYTINSDGSISTTAGTATQNSNITVTMTLPAGTYYVSGCPDGGNAEEPFNYNAAITGIGDPPYRVTNSTMVSSFTLTETTEVTWRFRVYSGQSIDATTFYPMIYQYGDSTYQPYAMSNVELTAAIKAIQDQLANQ